MSKAEYACDIGDVFDRPQILDGEDRTVVDRHLDADGVGATESIRDPFVQLHERIGVRRPRVGVVMQTHAGYGPDAPDEDDDLDDQRLPSPADQETSQPCEAQVQSVKLLLVVHHEFIPGCAWNRLPLLPPSELARFAK